MDFDYTALGKSIKKYRTLAELTQKQLAVIVGCTDRHIGQIEKGKNVPSLAMTVSIANALNVGLDQLVCGDLNNRTNYFIQELVAFTEGFDAKKKILSVEMVKAVVSVLINLDVK